MAKKERPWRHFHGNALLVALIREADPAFRARLIEKLAAVSPVLVRLVEEFDFIFRDIVRLDDRSIQTCWRVIPEKDWLIAWKLTDEPTRELILRNLSDRCRKDFLAAAAAVPKMPRAQVVAVQIRIAKAVKELLVKGKLGLRSKRYTPSWWRRRT